ncbi:MAG: carboxypeptidase-like regulatory domain-containing protein [Flavobacteriales bacterium]
MDHAPQFTRLNLSKLQRCDQEWGGMPEIPGGRLCQQCTKRIVDFTRMSAAAIARVHMDSDAPVCGMYRKEQLQPPPAKVPQAAWKAHPAMLSLVSMLMLEPATSTAQAEATPTEMVRPGTGTSGLEVTVPTAALADSVIIRGRVVERVEQKDEPAAFVVVYVKGTRIGTTTDADGNFALDLTALADSTDSVVLVMRYIGFEQMEQVVSLVEPEAVLFRLAPANLGVVAYYVHYTKPPFYEQIWRSVQRSFK